MRKINVRATNDAEEIAGIHFFAQCVDELMFDHSDDSYKAPALNVVSRALELKRVANHVKDKELPSETLRTFIDELKWGLGIDPVIEYEEKERLQLALKRVTTGSFSLVKLLPVIDLIIDHITNYGDRIAERIIQVVGNGKEKRLIRSLAVAFCAHVELEGHSRRYVYQHLQRSIIRFLKRPIAVDSSKLINRFIAGIRGGECDAIVVFKCGKEFGRFSDLATKWGVEILEKAPALSKNTDLYKSFSDDDDCLFICVNGRKAADPYQARDDAEYVIDMFSGVIRYLCHDMSLNFDQECVVEMNTEGRVWHALIGKKVNPMLCRNESNGVVEETDFRKLSELISGTHLDGLSTRKFVNALTYHRAALRAPVYETQLVSLWSALEGLLPSPDSGEVRIKYFAQVVSSILTLAYSNKLFDVVTNELAREADVSNYIKTTIAGKSFKTQVVQLICSNEYQQARLDVAAILSANPLLRFRLMELNESFSSAKVVLKTLQHHREKVEWHLHRIYWSRNLIVHSADTMPYMMTIVENLHDYLDLVVSCITNYAVEALGVISIDSVVQAIQTDYDIRIDRLMSLSKKGDCICTTENVIEIVFGGNNKFYSV